MRKRSVNSTFTQLLTWNSTLSSLKYSYSSTVGPSVESVNVLLCAISFQIPCCCTAGELCSASGVFERCKTWETRPKDVRRKRTLVHIIGLFSSVCLAFLSLSVSLLSSLIRGSMGEIKLPCPPRLIKRKMESLWYSSLAVLMLHFNLFVLFIYSPNFYADRTEILKPAASGNIWSDVTCVIFKRVSICRVDKGCNNFPSVV